MREKIKLKIQWPIRNELAELVNIYNQAIRNGISTGHTREFSRQARWIWYKSHDIFNYPIYVMKYDKKIIGYGSLSPYREGRQAMRKIAEVSFFLDEKYQEKGYGSILLAKMIYDCNRTGIKTLLAILLDVNKKSVGLLKKFGFKKWGHFRDVVEFEDKTCGQLIYGLKAKDSDEQLVKKQLEKLGFRNL